MNKPVIKSGRFEAGSDLQCGDNVVVEVAEYVRVGDRCVLPDNAYFSGRCVTIGNDFYGASHWGKRLEVGLNRRDEEDAVLMVGSRCTFHDNRIDLARRVTIGDDVGLSPEVVIYTHGYWQSILEGFPCRFAPVEIENRVIVGFRSVLLPGAWVEANITIGAQSVVSGRLRELFAVYAGNPARFLRRVLPPTQPERERLLREVMGEYGRSCAYRGVGVRINVDYPTINLARCSFDVETLTVLGEEDAVSDDFRDFLFKRGIRIYTRRPFRRLGRKT